MILLGQQHAHYFCSYFLLLYLLLITLFFFVMSNFVPIFFYLHLLFYIFFFLLYLETQRTLVRGWNATGVRQTRRSAFSAGAAPVQHGAERERASWDILLNFSISVIFPFFSLMIFFFSFTIFSIYVVLYFFWDVYVMVEYFFTKGCIRLFWDVNSF